MFNFCQNGSFLVTQEPFPGASVAASKQEEIDFAMIPLEDAAHLCIDMQRIFSKGGVWETPWMERVLPVVVDIAERYQERTIFTRFITPQSPDQRPGQWQRYYQRWKAATREHLQPDQLELVPHLVRFVPPAHIIDKPAYSAFYLSGLDVLLRDKGVRCLVVTGAETDVCVLSTVLDAVDRGFRVVIVEDALCSSSDTGHEALMTIYRTRMQEQIDVINSSELSAVWRVR
jgi:nicotinamidase-related amidase